MSRILAGRQLTPHLLLVLLALVAIPTACSDEFKSCEKTLTCANGPGTGGLGGGAGGDGGGDGDPVSVGGIAGAGMPCLGEGCECTTGQILCDGECVDPLTSKDFCGATDDCRGDKAGDTCGTGKDCVAGECILVCGAGRLICDEACVSPLENPMFCGATGACTDADRGFECVPGEACLGAECRSWGQASVLATRDDNHFSWSEVAVGPTGKAVVHFRRNTTWFGRMFNTANGTWHPETILSEEMQYDYEVAITDDDKVLALAGIFIDAWAMMSSTTTLNSFADFVTIPGQVVGTPFETFLGTGTGSAAVVAWRVSGAPGIYASRFNPNANNWGDVVALSSAADASYAGSAANDGKSLVVWREGVDKLVGARHAGVSWQTGEVPGDTPHGVAPFPSALINDAGEALVTYKTIQDNNPDETWGLSYSFEDDSWGTHFRIHSDPATLIATAQGSFAYALIDPDTRAEIWWRQSGKSISEMQTAKRQVLLEQPAEQLLVVSNSAGQLMALFVSDDDIYWTVLDRESNTWLEAIPFDRPGDSSISGLDAGMDKYGRVMVSWREADPNSVAVPPWNAVWARYFE